MKPSVRDWDFRALNRQHGWAWPWQYTIAESMIHSKFQKALPRNTPTRDVRPEHDLGRLRPDLPVLPLAAYDVWIRDLNPRHLLKGFRQIVIGNPDARPWRDAEPYPEELCLARGGLAELVVQEDGFLRRGDTAGSIVFATPDGWPVASSVDSDDRTRGLATYNAVALEWRGLNLTMAVWVTRREHGRPGWSMVPELWREFMDGASRDRTSMIGPLAESLALSIRRADARGIDVRPEVLQSALDWRKFAEDLMAKATTAKKEEPTTVLGGIFAGRTDAQKKRFEKARAKSRASGPQLAPRVDVNAAQAVIEALQAATAEAREVLEQMEDGSVAALERRFDELAEVVRDLREELGADDPDETPDTPA